MNILRPSMFMYTCSVAANVLAQLQRFFPQTRVPAKLEIFLYVSSNESEGDLAGGFPCQSGASNHFRLTLKRYQQLQDWLKGEAIASFCNLRAWLAQTFLLARGLVLFLHHQYSQGLKSFAMDLLAVST